MRSDEDFVGKERVACVHLRSSGASRERVKAAFHHVSYMVSQGKVVKREKSEELVSQEATPMISMTQGMQVQEVR